MFGVYSLLHIHSRDYRPVDLSAGKLPEKLTIALWPLLSQMQNGDNNRTDPTKITMRIKGEDVENTR